jgi:hypothetical protein
LDVSRLGVIRCSTFIFVSHLIKLTTSGRQGPVRRLTPEH